MGGMAFSRLGTAQCQVGCGWGERLPRSGDTDMYMYVKLTCITPVRITFTAAEA